MMRLLLLTLLVPLLARAQSGPSASEPPAVARYHEGAQLYVDGDLEAAAQAVDAGLAEAPADARLRALRELIRQQDQNGGGGQRPDDSDAQDETDDGTPEPQGGPNEPEQAPPDDAPGDTPNGTPPPGGEGDAGSGSQPAGMSRAEAEALLDAVGGDEKLLLRDLRRTPSTSRRPERDW